VKMDEKQEDCDGTAVWSKIRCSNFWLIVSIVKSLCSELLVTF